MRHDITVTCDDVISFAYHTRRDSLDTVSPGSIYHMGANSAAMLLSLLQLERIDDATSVDHALYFDLLGW